MAKYSIHRCLAELKLIDSKINKAINNINIVGEKKASADNVKLTNMTENQFKETALRDFQSVSSYIKRRKLMKEAVVNSNSGTTIEISGINYTVAAAIERKKSIEYEKSLLQAMKTQFNNSLKNVSMQNELVEAELNKQIQALLGSDKNKADVNVMNALSESYRKQNNWQVIDPLNVKEKIQKLEEEIDNFETEVDYKLSTSNAITEVEILE